jgi:hypothetical protein
MPPSTRPRGIEPSNPLAPTLVGAVREPHVAFDKDRATVVASTSAGDSVMREDPFFALRDRAFTLAGTGRYKVWDRVAYALLAEGFSRDLIDRVHLDPGAVMMITRACAQAQAARPRRFHLALFRKMTPMLLFERERQRRVRSQARTLANTGQFNNWREVETALVGQGRNLAPQALHGRFVRLLLNARCAHARRRGEDERRRQD